MAMITQAQAAEINESCENICNLIEGAQQLVDILTGTDAAGSLAIKSILVTIHDSISESAGEASGIQEKIIKLIQDDITESRIRNGHDVITQRQTDERRGALYSMVKHFSSAEDKLKAIELIDRLTDNEIAGAIRSKQAIEIVAEGGRVTIRTLEGER